MTAPIEIHGFCEPHFAALLDAFRENFEKGYEIGASLAVTHHGKPVVDLWAGHADKAHTRPWDEDSIAGVASTTKIPTTLSFLMLIDRGLVALDAPVATYWPEFGAGGKSHVTVRDALTHSAGVPGFEPPVPFEAMFDWDSITRHVAAQPHWFDGRRVVCYHAHTYGFILGEIMRRVDGRGPSQFFREEIADKAGIDFQIGLRSRDDLARLAPMDSLVARPRRAPGSDTNAVAARVERSIVMADPGVRTTWEYRRADIPSVSGYANARSIARLCAIGAQRGELDGVRYLSEDIVDEAAREQVYAEDPILGWVRLGLGFGLHSKEYPAPSPTSFHWGGFGGSYGIADPAAGISCGYAMNNMFAGWYDRRSARIWAALGQVIANL